jgi:hypothetical protein
VDASQGGGGRQVGSPVDRRQRGEAPPGPGRTPDELTVVTISPLLAFTQGAPERLVDTSYRRTSQPRSAVLEHHGERWQLAGRHSARETIT